ncbi:hypothetical protein KCP77_01790 [Salmonella enterica subsp. enterica]|nr:hypothetical protein KCP77_01790 [Salmonella enterica subsp. enterica]
MIRGPDRFKRSRSRHEHEISFRLREVARSFERSVKTTGAAVRASPFMQGAIDVRQQSLMYQHIYRLLFSGVRRVTFRFGSSGVLPGAG